MNDNFLNSANAPYIAELFFKYSEDSDSVDQSWKDFFKSFNEDELLDGIFSPAEFHPSMMNLDGYLIDKVSLDVIVNAIEAVQTKSFFDLSIVEITNNRYQFNKFFYTSIRKLKDYFIFDKVKKHERESTRAKFPITSASELAEYLSCIYEYGLLKQPITCVPVGRNTFYLYCNNRNSD